MIALAKVSDLVFQCQVDGCRAVYLDGVKH